MTLERLGGRRDRVREGVRRDQAARKLPRKRVAPQHPVRCVRERFTRTIDAIRVWGHEPVPATGPGECGTGGEEATGQE